MKEKQRIEIPPELVRRAQAGDQAAFSELYQRSGAAVYRTIFSMVRDEDTAWDVHQNSYLLAWKNLGKLEKPEAFLPWLRRIAVNETVKALQKEQPLRFTELTEEDGEALPLPETRPAYLPEPELDRQEAARLVREILDGLPQKQRLILGMYYYEELSVREIADTLGVSQGTVKTQLHLGRKKVEAQVRRLEGEGVKLYGLAPMAFLEALLRRQEPARPLTAGAMRRALDKAAVSGGEPVPLTARPVGSGFFHTVPGRICAGLLIAAVAAGGFLGWRALRSRGTTPAGDYRPTQTLAVTEPARLSSEDPTEPETALPTEAPTELETAPPTEPPAAERRLENPFSGPLESAYPYILAAIYNEPWDQGVPAPTVNWNAGGEDRLVIYPRYADSVVSARRIVYDAEDRPSVEETPVYSTRCGPGDCIAASLERPAGRPCWLITVQAPENAEASWVLARNSVHGTPQWELPGWSAPSADPMDWEACVAAGGLLLKDLGCDSLPYPLSNDPAELRDHPNFAIGCALHRCGGEAPYELLDWIYGQWLSAESAAWPVKSLRRDGDTWVMDTGVVHEYYMNQLYEESFVEGQGSPKLSVAEQIAGQARLFERDRLLGYGGETAAEGEELQFNLHGLLVYNPTLAAKTVSVTVNGQAAGEFALTEGDFYTWLPLDFPNEPGDRAVRVELRVTEALFGAPEQAILSLWPDMSSIFRGGR